jgi:hypothetical protein
MAVATFALATITASAQDSNYPALKSKQFISKLATPTDSCFLSQELALSFGYSYTVAPDNWNNHGSPGVDFQADYWFKREFAIGVDTGVTDTHDVASTLLDHIDFPISARLPLDVIPGLQGTFIGKHFAPKISVSPIGLDFKTSQPESTFAGGLEYRFTSAIGILVQYKATLEAGTPAQKNSNDRRGAFASLVLAF